MRDNGRAANLFRALSPRPAGSSGACGSGVPFQFPLPPVSTLARGIKFLNVAAVQRPHDADARKHRRATERRHQDQGFHRRLPFRGRVLGLRQLRDVVAGVFERY